MYRHLTRCRWLVLLAVTLLSLFSLMTGCSDSGSDDPVAQGGGGGGAPPPPPPPPPPARTGVEGQITNNATQTGIAGATVATVPDTGVTAQTDANGDYTLELPAGIYTVNVTATNFANAQHTNMLVTEGNMHDCSMAMTPTANVVVNAGADATGDPGGTVNLTATVTPMDGSTVQTVQWTQTNSVAVTINGGDTLTPSVVLPGLATYKDEIIKVLEEPPVAEADLPPYIPYPNPYHGGLQDRFDVVGIPPMALEDAEQVTLKCTVTTSTGTYSDSVVVAAELPFGHTTGMRNVPIGEGVLLHGKDQAAYNWVLTRPGGSSAALDSATVQNPSFTPDVTGTYGVQETNSGTNFNVTAGLWTGAISGQDAQGRPLSATCTGCHAPGGGGIAPDMFTDWAKSGHAEIFTANLNTRTGYGTQCFGCHTVGYNTGVANNGIDDQADYQAFLGSGMLGVPNANNWTNMLANFPATAKLSNIQCEHCHGPQNSPAHFNNTRNYSLASEVCGSCHGEPLNHGRFQQWQLSGHANYERAMAQGMSSGCTRCHSAEGFRVWDNGGFVKGQSINPADPDGNPGSNDGWTADTVHPQTCGTCHEVHDPGTKTSDANDVKLRVEDNTPALEAGFTASSVGHGALCMTCHNGRRGLFNDQQANTWKTSQAAQAPHAGPQGDILMGENAFFVTVGARGPHSLIPDTCSECHMQRTDPPPTLSKNKGGTNHTFFASTSICTSCHASVDGEAVKAAYEADLAALEDLIAAKIQTWLTNYLATLGAITLDNPEWPPETVLPDVVINPGSVIRIDAFTESHGRQAVDLTVNPGAGEQQYHLSTRNIKDATNTTAIFGAYTQGIVLYKAGWNYFQLHSDSSHGIHNPPFVSDVIAATENTLNATNFSLFTPYAGP
ncbi:MAG: carboxypeptidase regulatory-like domain-containing protein [Armatimonadetes bacterium]|nr:carboxypeptidase regulatory-like domain-containing protein [Armatimonadota bacterium]